MCMLRLPSRRAEGAFRYQMIGVDVGIIENDAKMIVCTETFYPSLGRKRRFLIYPDFCGWVLSSVSMLMFVRWLFETSAHVRFS